MANDRISGAGVEVLVEPDSAKARTSGGGVEVLISPTSGKARSSQMLAEALISPTSAKARFSGVLAEAIFHRTEPPPPTDYFEAVLNYLPWVWYRMGEPSGTVATDASGNERHGTYNGGPTLDQAGAIAAALDDGAVLFDATNDYLISPVVFNKAQATMICFFYYDGTPPGGLSFIAGCADGDGSPTNEKNLGLTSAGKAQFYAFDGGTHTAVDPNALSTGWHMLCGRVNGSTCDLFVDGASVASVACGATYTSYTVPNVLVGGATTDKARRAGLRDEFILYDYALTDDNIADIWDFSQHAGHPSFATVIIA